MKKIITKVKTKAISVFFLIALLSCTPLFSSTNSDQIDLNPQIIYQYDTILHQAVYDNAWKAAKITANIFLLSGALSLAEDFLDILDENSSLSKNELFLLAQRGLAISYALYKSLSNLYHEAEA